MDNETYEGQEIAAEGLGFVGEQSEDVGGLVRFWSLFYFLLLWKT